MANTKSINELIQSIARHVCESRAVKGSDDATARELDLVLESLRMAARDAVEVQKSLLQFQRNHPELEIETVTLDRVAVWRSEALLASVIRQDGRWRVTTTAQGDRTFATMAEALEFVGDHL